MKNVFFMQKMFKTAIKISIPLLFLGLLFGTSTKESVTVNILSNKYH